jgi:tRNA(fMet)-specific endonuclease VapC
MFLLDTNTCIYIINNEPPSVRQKFASLDISEIVMSSITLFELDSGFRKGSKVKDNLRKLEQFASVIKVMPFDAQAARRAGEVRQYLREKGTPIGDMDMLIAGHALALDAVVVTNNGREFERVPGLKVENWLEG